MIFDINKHGFDLFLKNWSPEKKYVLYGASKDTPQLLKSLDYLIPKKKLKVDYVVDDDKNSVKLYEYPVGSINENYDFSKSSYNKKIFKRKNSNSELKIISFKEFEKKDLIKKYQIIVTSDINYTKYKNILIKKNLIEDLDFCNYKKIAAIWPYKIAKKIHIWRTDFLLTEKCSLNCTFCNMYMPYYKNQKHRDYKDLENDLNSYFNKVDFVSVFHLVGGEPLFSPYVAKVLNLINKKYKKKIGYLFLTTNGTIEPKEDVLKAMKQINIDIHISDYTKHINYLRKLNNVKDRLTKNNINFLIRKYETWTDFGDPTTEKFKTTKESIEHFDSCSAPFRGLHNSKYYYCHLNTSAILADKFKENKNDYIDLDDKNFNPENLLKLDLGFPKKGYVTFCNNCYGCNTGLGKKVSPKNQGLNT